MGSSRYEQHHGHEEGKQNAEHYLKTSGSRDKAEHIVVIILLVFFIAMLTARGAL